MNCNCVIRETFVGKKTGILYLFRCYDPLPSFHTQEAPYATAAQVCITIVIVHFHTPLEGPSKCKLQIQQRYMKKKLSLIYFWHPVLPLHVYTQMIFFFHVLLTVHLSITLANDQLDAQLFLNTFITVLYVYMFRAKSCSSSGRQIVLIHHLVLSLSVSDDTRCCIITIWPPEDEQDIARNMYM